MSNFIIENFKDIEFDSLEYGNKAINLAKLMNQGIKIPASWVISSKYPSRILTRSGFKQYTSGFKIDDANSIYSFLSSLNHNEYKELWDEVYKFLKENKGRYVIRSSHSLEDSAKHSFAGQFHTEINHSYVTNTVQAIINCWKQCFSEEAIHYFQLIGYQYLNPCGILIQELIKSQVSGVLFKTGDRVLVNANWGLAKSVVDGESEVDQAILDLKTNKISIDTAKKDLSILPVYNRANLQKGENIDCPDLPGRPQLRVHMFNNTSNLTTVFLNDDLRKMSCLTEQLTKELNDLTSISGRALMLSNYDTEWAVTPESEIYLLQIRPLTSDLNIEPTDMKYESSKGLGLVDGIATGKVYLVETEKQAKEFPKGGIIATTRLIGPVLNAALRANGCIVESRSPLSHSAIISRELGIPSVGAIDIRKLELGMTYKLNGRTGELQEVPETHVKSFSNFDSSKHSNKYGQGNMDIRPVLAIMSIFNELPKVFNDLQTELVSNNSREYNLQGFENAPDASTLKLWCNFVKKLPKNSNYIFESTDGNFVNEINII